MKHLIINADDFGLTQGVNQAVIRAHTQGVLTSATLMAGGFAWREAVDLAQANPSLGVGVHLTLTALRPILPPVEVASLVDRDGRFRRQFWRAPLLDKEQVTREWRAQIQRLVDAGLRPTHLDSHHHIHLWPGFTEIVVELAREFELPCLRLISPKSFALMDIGGWQKWVAAASWRRGDNALARPRTVVALETLPRNPAGLKGYLEKLVPGVHEIYCHPGSDGDAQLADISSLTTARVQETERLCDPEFRKGLEEASLVSYKFFNEERVE